MLSYKNNFLKYRSLIKLRSFNTNSLNKYIWNIRNNIKYIFYFLLKKTILTKLFLKYKIVLYLLKIKKTLFNHLKTQRIDYLLLNNIFNLFSFFFNVIYNNCYLYTFLRKSIYTFSLKTIAYYNYYKYVFIFSTSNLVINSLNYLFTIYKTYILFIYIWLYSLKFLNFYVINYASIPNKKSIYTVLRSPHKDKKSREKFKINKIKKNISYPSFFNTHSNLLFHNFVNETILIKNSINILK